MLQLLREHASRIDLQVLAKECAVRLKRERRRHRSDESVHCASESRESDGNRRGRVFVHGEVLQLLRLLRDDGKSKRTDFPRRGDRHVGESISQFIEYSEERRAIGHVHDFRSSSRNRLRGSRHHLRESRLPFHW